jgi:hypothetical protein
MRRLSSIALPTTRLTMRAKSTTSAPCWLEVKPAGTRGPRGHAQQSVRSTPRLGEMAILDMVYVKEQAGAVRVQGIHEGILIQTEAVIQ